MYKEILGIGVAGNFAHHLEQAKEMADFKDVVTEEPEAPKGIFPFYIPHHDSFIGTYPLSSDTIIKPHDEDIQLEPEVAVLFDIEYDGEIITNLHEKSFSAYNDCSIRQEGAKKISHKKNWGANSKGISQNWIEIDAFSPNGTIGEYNIVSFIKRDGKVIQYGDDCAVNSYSYFGDKLKKWIIEKLNTQKDFGPLEDISQILSEIQKPKQLIVSIGATSYTEFGEHNYLEVGDEIYVILYNSKRYFHEEIVKYLENQKEFDKDVSILRQIVRG